MISWFAVAVVPGGGCAVTVSPSGGTTLGTPDTATVTITDNDSPPSFSLDDVTHNEGNSGTTSYTFTVTKTGATQLASSVDWETVNGTAIAPGDFTAVAATTLNFAPSDTTKQVMTEV